MRTILYLMTSLAVMGLAFWAYSENYQTQEALNRVERLQARITDARETLSVLRAEWAYLNRPERLRDLADLNFDRLGLLPLAPEQFTRVDQIGFPPPPVPIFDNLVDLTDTVPVSARSDTGRYDGELQP